MKKTSQSDPLFVSFRWARCRCESLIRWLQRRQPARAPPVDDGTARVPALHLVTDARHHEMIAIPPGALRLWVDMPTRLRQRRAVTVLPQNAGLTPQEVAGCLNVSRRCLVQLIGEGRLPARKVGTRRRVASGDLRDPRRVIAPPGHGPQGANPRFIVSSLAANDRHICDKRCCARGEAKNRVNTAPIDLFNRRAGCPSFLSPAGCVSCRPRWPAR